MNPYGDVMSAALVLARAQFLPEIVFETCPYQQGMVKMRFGSKADEAIAN